MATLTISYMHTYKWRLKTMVKNWKKQFLNYFLVILGTFLLSFGAAVFLSEPHIVNGGVGGIAVIVQYFVPGFDCYDIVVAALTVFFWFIGLIFVGKDFALKTALASALYIGFIFMFKRVPFFQDLAKEFAGTKDGATSQIGNLILCGIFGGVFVGGGVAVAFLGGGSTGGIDVLQVLMRKHLNIKENVSSIILEGIVIIVGMAAMRLWNEALCGILCAFVSALVIEAVYVKSQTAYQVDIISNEWEKISWFAQDQLGRGATIIHAQGGYKGEERIILRIVFDKPQYDQLRNFIAKVDPKAFVTFTQTNAVYGEGFDNHKVVDLAELMREAKKMKKEKQKQKKENKK